MPKSNDQVAQPVDVAAGFPRRRADSYEERVQTAKSSKQKTILPKPPGFNVTPERLFKWRAAFSTEESARSVLHLYREWPAIDRRLIGEQKPKLIRLFDNSEGSEWTHSDDWSDYILQNREWGGSGKYKVMVTEIGVPGCICMSKFQIEDSEFPPRVDPRILVVGHPENKGYIEGLRAEGKRLPGDDPEAERIEKEEEEEMNVATEVVGVLKDALNQQREESAELRDKVEELRENSGVTPEDRQILSKATATSFDMIAEGVKTGMGIVADQAKAVSTASAPSFNPVELFRVGMEAGGGRNSGMEIASLFIAHSEKTMTAMQQMQHEMIEFLSKRDEAEETPEPPRVEPKTELLDEVRRIKEIGEVLGFKIGRASEPAATAAQVSTEPSWIDRIMKFYGDNPSALMATLALAANIVYNMRTDKPQAPQEALAKAGAPGVPGAQPAAPPAPNPAQVADQARAQMNKFLEFLTPHFLNHYNRPDLDGHTFAADLHTMIETSSGTQLIPDGAVTELGRQQYLLMVKAGQGRIDQLIREWAPIWTVISNSPHTVADPQKYQEFWQEFFTFDTWAQQQAQQQESKIRTMPPVQ
jgi:hypothetical protein